jgi:hypothetical protein
MATDCAEISAELLKALENPPSELSREMDFSAEISPKSAKISTSKLRMNLLFNFYLRFLF